MNLKLSQKHWLCLAATLLAGVTTAITLRTSVEPLTGYGSGFYIVLIVLSAALAGTAAWLFFRKWWGILAGILLLLSAMIAWPTLTRPGLKLALINATPSPIRITAHRSRYPHRFVDIPIAARSSIIYLSAAGNYSDSMEITLRSANRELKATVAQLKSSVVVFNSGGFQLRAGRPQE